MGTKEKYGLIHHIKEMMLEKGVKRLFLDKTLSLKEPDRNNPYSVSEICIDNDGTVVAWCHWDQRNCGLNLEYFQGYEVQEVERMVEQTLGMIKRFRVPATTYIEVVASSEANAIKTAKTIANLQGALDINELILRVDDKAPVSVIE